MAEFAENRDFRTVTLVDRTGQGGTEIIYDGVRIKVPRGTTEIALPRFVAEWLFSRTTQQMVWSQEEGFTQRFGIKDLDEELAALLGPEAGNLSPITLESRAEGWDTTGVEGDRGKTRTIELQMPRSLMRERQGTVASTFREREG